jgi:hypothetical protein
VYVIGLASALCFGLGTPAGTLAGLILLHLSFALDNVDGEIARVMGLTSLTGAYLDTFGHIVINSTVLFGLAFGVFNTLGEPMVLVLGFLAAYSTIPISRYSIDHELLNALRTGKKITRASSEENEPAGSKKHDEFGWLTRTGFPFIASPFNILLITACVIGDTLVGPFQWTGVRYNCVTLLLLYYAVALSVIQVASLVRNSRKKRIEQELEGLLKRRQQ